MTEAELDKIEQALAALPTIKFEGVLWINRTAALLMLNEKAKVDPPVAGVEGQTK
jgi:hypothetical protein